MNALLRFTVAFITGIVLYNTLNDSYLSIIFCIFGITLLATITGIYHKKRSRFWLGTLLTIAALTAGWLNVYWHDQRLEATHLSKQKDIEAYQVTLTTTVEQKRNSYKVEGSVSRVLVHKQWREATGQVVFYIKPDAHAPAYGDVLLVFGKPQLVTPPANPEQFDYQRFLSYKHIFHQQYLTANQFRQTGQNTAVWYKSWAYQLSHWADQQLKKLIPWPREYAVTKAMVLGIRDEMDFELTQAYSVAGAVHVLSVSGFHIAIFVWILSQILGFLQKRRHGRWLYLVTVLGILWFYAVLTGLSAPVIRSALMISVFLLAKPLKRQQNILTALFGSALILLWLDPLLVYSVSFQLSYTALAGIIYLQPIVYQIFTFENTLFDRIWQMTAVALAAQAATFPLAVYYFHQFPTYFWLANPAVMVLAFLQLPAALATVAFSWVPYVSDFLGWTTTIITWALNESVVQTERLPGSKLSFLSFSWVEVVLCYAIIVGLFQLWRSRNKQWLWATAAISVTMLGIQAWQTNQQNQQKMLVVHAIPHATAVSVIEGRRATLIADKSLLEDHRSFNFFLNNLYATHGIQTLDSIALDSSAAGVRHFPFGKLVFIHQQKILFIEEPIAALPVETDVVIVQNTAFKDFKKVSQVFGNQKIIFDNTNKNYAIQNVSKEATAAHFPYHFTPLNNAWVKNY
jgi:competence protein ComEC